MVQVARAADAARDGFYIISGGGYPSLLNHIKNSVLEINELPQYTHFAVALDCDEVNPEERREEIEEHIRAIGLRNGCLCCIVRQKVCIETWLLGNKIFCPTNPTDRECVDCLRHYNVRENDPEALVPPDGYRGSVASYHEWYLKAIFRERTLSYSKQNPGVAKEGGFYERLKSRVSDTGHVSSFNSFTEMIRALG